MIQLTNHVMFESIAFNKFVIDQCLHIISFWPKNKDLNINSANHLFLGGLQSNQFKPHDE
jgi:hypothetical protein